MKYCTVCNSKYDDTVSFCAVDGEVLEDDPTTIVNSTLDGQYHVEAMLGKGGMGAVYRARHILLGDRVAIKVLPPQMRNNAEWLRRFRREGQAARRFRHPNAVTVYDLRTTSDGLIYMVMEYVEGHTLDAELKKRTRFAPADALSVLEPVMSVLNAAHAQGVVHRDLKPENIMIGNAATNGEPVVKLLDLGIAKISEVAGSDAGGTTALTVAGQVLGTPYYMSPEQWGDIPNDGSSEIDGRADIYSLGCVFYELIAGRRPFNGLTLQEIRREHVATVPPALHNFKTDVPEAFSLAIARAMAKDRGERQSTAGELAKELRASLGLSSSDSAWSTPAGRDGEAGAADASSAGYTEGSVEARNTNAEVVAPTIVTLDAPPRPPANPAPPYSTGQESAQSNYAPPQSGSTNPNAFARGTTAQPPDAYAQAPAAYPQPQDSYSQQSSSYAQQPSAAPQSFATPSYTPSDYAAAAPARRSPVVPIIAGIVGLFLIVGLAVGGWFIYQRSQQKSDGGEQGTSVGNDGTKTGPGGTETASVETMRYWLDVDAGERKAGNIELYSGDKFAFSITPHERGYLYIVGPGDKNAPTTFLTAQPVPESGVKTNEVQADARFKFPGSGQVITLDEHTGTEQWTIIFSTQSLTSPAFLSSQAGHELTGAEKQEWADFRAKYKANAPETAVNDENSKEPYVSIKMPQSKEPDNPVIFDVIVEHKAR